MTLVHPQLLALEFDGVTVVLIVCCTALFLLLVKTVHRFKTEVLEETSVLEDKISRVERHAVHLKATLAEIKEEVDEKIDYDYLNKRIDGLLELIKNK
ncbi:MAG: hypothetical protein QW343_00150 [Candidatus Norongarragalinales archaeon]